MSVWLVVGLGNPGPTYAFHRHNVGFMVADALARRAGAGFAAPRGMRGDICETRITSLGIGAVGADARRVILLKPRTYMNNSGAAAAKACAYYGVKPAEVIAIHDELDLDFGRLRLKRGGGDNGHNGLKSLRSSLGTGDFLRVRFGIGRPPGRQAPADFVLSPFPISVREELALDVDRAADAVEALLNGSLETAQNSFNR